MQQHEIDDNGHIQSVPTCTLSSLFLFLLGGVVSESNAPVVGVASELTTPMSELAPGCLSVVELLSLKYCKVRKHCLCYV